ncbi:predicted protein [Thalassiosira pseudonana CCMP1335]|uniref:HMG box domain-containing protein n=1 Tax=Thalassiosira pseudonana TaxID=35128 RepID=B8BSJ1_THAPS|nr:predicted protein [Thalassiosira pseudonana CCMP1335]EED96731.1 predicted protein [Thalassiosira pseudonana CCMP1335]
MSMASSRGSQHQKKGSSFTMAVKKKVKIIDRPLNSYNLYFILERALFLQSKGAKSWKEEDRRLSLNFHEYCDLELPPFPMRYQSLVLMDDWFMHGKNRHKTRKHTKSDGGINFRDLARAVSASWKNVDPEVLNFVRVVAAMVLQRRDDLRDGAGTEGTKKYVVSTPEVKPKVVETVARGTPFPPNTRFSATTIYRDAGNVSSSGGEISSEDAKAPDDEVIKMW